MVNEIWMAVVVLVTVTAIAPLWYRPLRVPPDLDAQAQSSSEAISRTFSQ